jgi:hypothetical protein
MILALALIAGLSLGANPQPTAVAGPDPIRQTVEPILRAFLAAAERLDVEATMAFCQDSPQFRFLLPDGRCVGYGEVKTLFKEAFAGFASQKLPTRELRTQVLAPDAVLCSWIGGDDLVRADGSILRSDPYAGTYLFQKLNGVWKLTYCHESGLPFASATPVEPAHGK